MKSFFNWGVKKEVERLREQNKLLGEELDREIAFREDLGRIAKEEMDKTNELGKSLKMKEKLYVTLCDLYDELQTKYDLLEKELIKKNKLIEKEKVEKKELKAKIKEQEKELSKRYIVKTLKPTKPTKQVMNIKNGAKQSKIIKKIKEEL